jgi:hypothetical protein
MGDTPKLPKWPGWDGDKPLRASSACPICGKDTPHGHYNDEAEIEQAARPTFEFYLRSWLGTYLPDRRMWRGQLLDVQGWTQSYHPQRSERRPPDYACPVVEALWGLWLDAWLSKPSWCNAFDAVAMQKQIERQTPDHKM